MTTDSLRRHGVHAVCGWRVDTTVEPAGRAKKIGQPSSLGRRQTHALEVEPTAMRASAFWRVAPHCTKFHLLAAHADLGSLGRSKCAPHARWGQNWRSCNSCSRDWSSSMGWGHRWIQIRDRQGHAGLQRGSGGSCSSTQNILDDLSRLGGALPVGRCLGWPEHSPVQADQRACRMQGCLSTRASSV